MANFKPGDVVRCVRSHILTPERGLPGDIFTVRLQDVDNTFAVEGYPNLWFGNDRFVLDDTTIVSKILEKYDVGYAS